MVARVCPICSRITQPDSQCGCEREHTRQRNAQPHWREHRSQRHANLRAHVFACDGNRCVDCGATEDLTLDYIVPLQDGGAMTSDNSATRCRSCNARAGRRR